MRLGGGGKLSGRGREQLSRCQRRVRLNCDVVSLAVAQQTLRILTHPNVILNLVDRRQNDGSTTTTITTITTIITKETLKARRAEVGHADCSRFSLAEKVCVRSPLRTREVANVQLACADSAVRLSGAVQQQEVDVGES